MTENKRKTRTYLSKEDREHVVRLVKKMLGMGKYSSDIKRAVAEEFQLSRRSVERYLKRAREEMVYRMQVEPDVHRAESYYFYRSVINNPNVHPREQLRARERMDKLLGLEIPVVVQADSDLSPAKLKAMSDEEFDALYEKRMK
ncbi:hypothetical protein Pan241w_54380 [Gimesia alba]|uniref:Uncharacterized protein n=1 Tax=Gimesia alba TaxID=2527973 RepID=A0A517RN60_9PLAN|nr:hypothetical protein [Gimesia alba]QDT45318.1 hypothetical protein Pan241w_54380 [Gimesia alba]